MTDAQTVPSPGARIAEQYERHFVPTIGKPFADHLVALARLAPGERVLDVGCGTGVVARLAAQQVGANGVVVGLDVNPDMLAVARASGDGASGIEWRHADAESLPFPDAGFDVVLCQLSLMFVADRARALGEMRRVLAPGGRLLLNVPARTPLFTALADAMGRHVGPRAGGFVERVFSLGDAEELRRLLAETGFREVEVATGAHRLELPPAETFLRQYVASTPLAIEVARADPAARAAIEEEVVARWRDLAGDAAIEQDQPFLAARALR